MLNNWKEEALALVRSDAPVGYRSFLIRMKEAGISSAEAEQLFTEIRNIMITEANEEVEDRVLDVLDIVTGYCSPHNRVW